MITSKHRERAMTKRRQPGVAVLPVHFEDRSGAEFERLCFA
jgi:hypothetical protein